jgi:CubicO group peptidase (beta-lactamase class C family)
MDPVASAQSTITDLMAHRTGLPAHNFAYFLNNDSIPAAEHTTILFLFNIYGKLKYPPAAD